MTYRDTVVRLNDYRRRLADLRTEMRALQARIEPEEVGDIVFEGWDGEVSLSQLFGDKTDLFLIHNMGQGCPNCTLWADGFNGVLPHLESRAAFVVTSPDDPDTQKAFAASRGWRFRMVSHRKTDFARDMGYRQGDDWRAGVSVFRKDGERIARVSDTGFGPGDDFCVAWHFFDLLPEGGEGWRARYSYS
jgi:predicted dithiol-disulfide oxidoreductase (DUF899 family)